MQRDSVDRHIEQWLEEIPDLDPLAEGVITRMQLLVKHLKHQKHAAITSHELEDYEYDTLHMLGGCGPDHRATPTEIATWLHMSPAAITGRLDALERRGFIRREASSDDRRKVIVELTPAGRRVWRASGREQGAEEERILAPLTQKERQQLAGLLRRMLLVVDDPGLLKMPSEVVKRQPK